MSRRGGAVVADDLEACARDTRGEPAEPLDERGHVPAVEDRPDVEHQRRARSTRVSGGGEQGRARIDHLDPVGMDAEVCDDLPLRELEIVSTRAARLAQRRARTRRRRPSLHVNHSGRAANETSWMATTNGTGRRSGAA
jgi:hypothetical protein